MNASSLTRTKENSFALVIIVLLTLLMTLPGVLFKTTDTATEYTAPPQIPRLDNTPQNAVAGPGLSQESFPASEVGKILSQNNTGKAVSAVTMHNGYLFVPMGADHGGGNGNGAFAFYDVSDPRRPEVVFDSRDYRDQYHDENSKDYVGNWAEIHSLPIIGNRMVISETDRTNAGFAIFDASNLYDDNPASTPEVIGRFRYPGVTSPTNYDGYSFSLACQGGKYVYAPTGTTGLFVVDISNPTRPQLVTHLPTSQLSGVSFRSAVVIGDWLVLTEGNHGRNGILVMDISDPTNPVQIGYVDDISLGYQGFMYGSEFFTTNSSAGIQSYDLSDPANITPKTYNRDASRTLSGPEYGFGKDGFVFIGHYPGLTKWDLNASGAFVTRCDPTGPEADDYAFLTPLGNFAAITSDHNHTNKLNFGVHQAGRDELPPAVNFVLPKNNSTRIQTRASVGISFTDFIDALSINENTLQVREVGSTVGVAGSYSQMFGFVNFTPDQALEQDATYEVVVKAGGVKDWSGNAPDQDQVISRFSTGSEVLTFTPPKLNPVTAIKVGETADFSINTDGASTDARYSWDFGDGSPETALGTSLTASHRYTKAGNFVVTLTVRSSGGTEVKLTDLQSVSNPLTATAPSKSSTIVYDAQNELVWNVNPDNNSVTATEAAGYTKVYETPVGENPQSLAVGPNNTLWVANRNGTLSVISRATGQVQATHDMPYGSAPMGIVVDEASGVGYVSLEATKQVVRVSLTTGSITGRLAIGPWPRDLALDAERQKLWVTRFISPDEAGQLSVVNTESFTLEKTVALRPSTTPESETNGRGLPNYLGALAISPDGTQLFVPSKKDNIYRGGNRDGQGLTFETTVRSMGAQINLDTEEEAFGNRVDFDNNDFATAAVYSPQGNRLFVSTNGSATIWIIDAYDLTNRSGVNSGGEAPDGMAISPDGQKLFVHNFMSRSVVAFDASLECEGDCSSSVKELGRTSTVANEALASDVLQGKQLFYTSSDTRMAQDGYMSCSSCHLDGGHDGRVWDFTNLGEGFRNTTDLQGKGRAGHGRLHWSANFDEVQDFENQIRTLSGGGGLMSDGDFAATEDPLGPSKEGKSDELDALAAYINSLTTTDDNPNTDNGELTAQAERGRNIFNSLDCAQCHGGDDFTDSPSGELHDIGTLKNTSGNRANGELRGIDSPTLRGLWFTAPYLHDGSAATLEEAVNAHTKEVQLPEGTQSMEDLIAYLRQIPENSTEVSSPPPVSQQIIADGTYYMKSPVSDQQMTARAQEKHNARMSNTSDLDDQRWIFKHTKNNQYTIQNKKTGRYLEVSNGRCGDFNANVGTWIDNIGDHKRWEISKISDNYVLKPVKCTNNALDREGGRTDANMLIHPAESSNINQQWKIINVTQESLVAKGAPAQQSKGFNTTTGRTINVYPNPVKTHLTLSGAQSKDHILLYDINGKQVLNEVVHSPKHRIDVSSLIRGAYLLQINGAHGKQFRRIVKE